MSYEISVLEREDEVDLKKCFNCNGLSKDVIT